MPTACGDFVESSGVKPPCRRSRDGRLVRSSGERDRACGRLRRRGSDGSRGKQFHQRSVLSLCPWRRRDRSPEFRGKAANFRSISSGASAFERLLAALHQLDDLAVHQIDAGNNHSRAYTGNAGAARNRLRSADGVGAVVKDGCGERGVGAPSVSTSHKSSGLPAPPEAITGMCVARRDGAGQRAIEAGLHAVGVHGSQQDFARAELLRRARPTRRRRCLRRRGRRG